MEAAVTAPPRGASGPPAGLLEPQYQPHHRPYGRDDARGIWVWLEQHDGRLEDVGLELAGKARALADACGEPLTAILLGRVADVLPSAAERASRLPVDRVLVAPHPLLGRYATDVYASALEQLVRAERPAILLMGATPDGRDLAGRLAVRFYTGLTADCTDLGIAADGGLLESHVVGFGGGIAAVIKCAHHRPQMATVRPGVFPMPPAPSDGRIAPVRFVSIELDQSVSQTAVIERHVHNGAGLTRAPVVVVGGGGMRGQFGAIEELAALLGGEVGATRVAVDQGWAPRERQIGQTGIVVRPKVAIACAVSGASQFTVGIDSAQTVIAINSDPQAPMFEAADYAVADDVFQILPALVAQLRLDGATPRPEEAV